MEWFKAFSFEYFWYMYNTHGALYQIFLSLLSGRVAAEVWNAPRGFGEG